MSFGSYLKLLEKSSDASEKRKLFEHLENIFLSQNNVSQFFSIKLKRIQFESEQNNFEELENILFKIVRDRIFLNVIEYFDFLLNHFVKVGRLRKVQECLTLRLKNSLQVKRYQGTKDLLKRFEKIICDDPELFKLTLENLHLQKDYSTLREFILKTGAAPENLSYEESLKDLKIFRVLFVNEDVDLEYHQEEKIDVCLARDLILEECEDKYSVRYFCKAILLSSDEELIDDLIHYLKSKPELEDDYAAVLSGKKFYVGEGKTRVDLGKDLLNYTSFSKIKKVNDSQILRNLGEETRAINFHQLASAMDADATGLIDNKSKQFQEPPKVRKNKQSNEEREFGQTACEPDGFKLEDLICAHLFMGQYQLALKAINQAQNQKDNSLDLASMVNLNYYKILCLIKIGDLSMAMQLTNEFLSELDINNHQYSTFTYLKYLIYVELGDNDQALSVKTKLSRRDPYFKKMTGGLL